MILAFLIAWLITGATVTTWWVIERGIPYRNYYGFSITLQAIVVLTITGPIYMWWSASNLCGRTARATTQAHEIALDMLRAAGGQDE